MDISTSQLKEDRELGNVRGLALKRLEALWDAQGKTPERKRWLRYYYRNRERFLAKRTEAKRAGRTPVRVRDIPENYVEEIEVKPGLIV